MANDTEPGPSPAVDSAHAVFLAWERLRLAYNAVLGLVVLFFAGSELPNREFQGFLLRAVIGANLCFCLGPVAEGYLALVGANRRVARWCLFVPGLLFGCLVASAALFSWHLRRFD
ncbi:MAG: hypothetical protein ACRC8S_15200 [Fimbriiglobus sp.]